jgi:hypothetical protein
VSSQTLELYAACLSEFEDEDVRAVVRKLATRARAEGETAFPALGELMDPLQNIRRKRMAEQKRQQERAAEIEQFWKMMPEWMEITGQTEEEILERWPGFKGTKGMSK